MRPPSALLLHAAAPCNVATRQHKAGRHHDPAEGSLSALCWSTSTSFVEPSGKTMFIEPMLLHVDAGKDCDGLL